MKLDGHIHINTPHDDKKAFIKALKKSGFDGGIVISLMPGTSYKDRLSQVIKMCEGEDLLFPFFWIDPTEIDALQQIDKAIEFGVYGFKIICSNFYPSDQRCIEVCKKIAQLNKPVMFHSGILWDGTNASGKYNRPVEFEELLQIKGLRFSLAHVSWPWCDECIAVYGKYCSENVSMPEHTKNGAVMFIDNTPGTPGVYRKDVFTKLYGTGYPISENVFFGTDNLTENYNVQWADEWITRDTKIYKELNLSEEHIENIFAKNVLKFINGDMK